MPTNSDIKYHKHRIAIILDFDYTISKLKLSSLYGQLSTILIVKNYQRSCDYFRGFRVENLPAMVEEEFKIRENKKMTIQHIDDLISQLYRNSSKISSVHRLIDLWDQKNWPRAVLSDQPSLQKLINIQMTKGWSAILSCRSYHAFKPLPDGLWAISAQLGLNPNQLIYIGDRYDTDAKAAFNFGCRFIHIDQLKDSKTRNYIFKSLKLI